MCVRVLLYLELGKKKLFVIYYSRAVIGVGVEEEDKKHTWMEDAEAVSTVSVIKHLSTLF